jgi:hypothetical protein
MHIRALLAVLLFPSLALSQVSGVAGGSPYSLCRGVPFTSCTASANTGTDVSNVAAAPGAGNRYYVYSIVVSNMHATLASQVDILAGSTRVDLCPAGANGGGCSRVYPSPLVFPVNTAINIDPSVAASIEACVTGCKGF